MVVRVRSATVTAAMGRLIEGGGERHRGAKHSTIHKKNVRRAVTGVLIESSDKVVRLSEARYACETRLWELEQQFEVKAAKVREEYLAAVLEIHATENGKQHAHHS